MKPLLYNFHKNRLSNKSEYLSKFDANIQLDDYLDFYWFDDLYWFYEDTEDLYSPDWEYYYDWKHSRKRKLDVFLSDDEPTFKDLLKI